MVLNVWSCMYIVPLYKGYGDKYECSFSINISLLSVVGKLYVRVLVKIIGVGTECTIGEEKLVCFLKGIKETGIERVCELSGSESVVVVLICIDRENG